MINDHEVSIAAKVPGMNNFTFIDSFYCHIFLYHDVDPICYGGGVKLACDLLAE